MYNVKIQNGIHSPVLIPKTSKGVNMVSHNHVDSYNILRDVNPTYVLPSHHQLSNNYYSFSVSKKPPYKTTIGMQFHSAQNLVNLNTGISSRNFNIDLPPNLTEYVIDKSACIELYDIYDTMESPSKTDFIENPFSKQKFME